jgi:hypothetical protein
VLALKKKLTHPTGAKPASASRSRRSAAELFAQARSIDTEAKRKALAKAERQRIKRLEELARTEEAIWADVENLLGQKRASAYDEATKLRNYGICLNTNRGRPGLLALSVIRERWKERCPD